MKAEREFFDVDLEITWQPVKGSPGTYEKILSRDDATGSYTRLLKFVPGYKSDETLVHDFCEEVYILKGTLVDLNRDEIYGEGFYACRPVGMKHGPYASPQGCIAYEVRYYPQG